MNAVTKIKARQPLAITLAGDIQANTSADAAIAKLYLRSTIVAVLGQPNSGKTFLALNLAAHHVTGAPWRGHKVRKGASLYVVCEGLQGLHNRVAALIEAGQLQRGAPLGIVSGTFDLCNNELDTLAIIDAAKRLAEMTGEEVVSITIDTLSRVMGGGDENSASDMGRVLANLERIRAATGAVVVIVHHHGKDSTKGARGHSSLRAALDTEIVVEGQSGARTVTVTKQRDLAYLDPLQFELDVVNLGTADDGEPITSCVLRMNDSVVSVAHKPSGRAQTAILNALEAQHREGKASTWTLEEMRALGRHLGFHRNTSRDAVLALANAGFLIATVGGYRLAHV